MWTITISVRDGKGATSKIEFTLPGTLLLAAVEAFVQTFLVTLDAVIGGVIYATTATYSFSLPGALKDTPDADSDVEEGALFVWSSAGGYTARNRIPTFLESKIVAGSRLVNTADSDVTNLVNQVTAGLAGTQPVDSRGADIQSLVSAKEMFQKSRRI